MISDIDNSILVGYLKNKLNEEESQKLIKWLEQNSENREFLFGLKDIYMSDRWEELSAKADTNTGWEELENIIQRRHRPKTIFHRNFKYAAVLLVFFCMGYLYKTHLREAPSMNTVMTADGERTTIILDDGTTVKLNQNSKLVYPSAFDKNNRKVFLTGEAYFEVTHNTKSPFLVDAGIYTVKVLGTKFNIDAYSDDICSYTSLKEGKVQILDKSEEELVISELEPGTQLIYNNHTNEYQTRPVKTENIGEWIKGQIILKQKSLQELSDILKYKYGYNIEISTDTIAHILYNITLEHESLEEILADITIITPQIHYSIDHEKRSVIFY